MTESIHQTRNMFFSGELFWTKRSYYKNTFFKNQNHGSGTLPRYVQNEYNDVGVVGVGVRKQFSAHGLPTTAVTLL